MAKTSATFCNQKTNHLSTETYGSTDLAVMVNLSRPNPGKLTLDLADPECLAYHGSTSTRPHILNFKHPSQKTNQLRTLLKNQAASSEATAPTQKEDCPGCLWLQLYGHRSLGLYFGCCYRGQHSGSTCSNHGKRSQYEHWWQVIVAVVGHGQGL